MRQFIVDCAPDKDGLIIISGKDFKYIRQVLRLCVGDMIKVLCPSNDVPSKKSFDATICKIDEAKKKIILQLCSLPSKNKKPFCENFDEQETNVNTFEQTEFWLLQFIPKPQKMELIIRQAVECAVAKIIPVIGEYTQKGSEKCLLEKSSSDNTENRKDRISRIIKEAMQQSGSLINTKLCEPCLLQDAIELVKQKVLSMQEQNKKSVLISLYEKNENSQTLHQVVNAKIDKSKDECKNTIGFAVIAVGCEGGISPTEISMLKDANFEIVHFNTNILRCETASLYGMASLQTTIFEI